MKAKNNPHNYLSNNRDTFQSPLQSQRRIGVLASRYGVSREIEFDPYISSSDQVSTVGGHDVADVGDPYTPSEGPQHKRSKGVHNSTDKNYSQGLELPSQSRRRDCALANRHGVARGIENLPDISSDQTSDVDAQDVATLSLASKRPRRKRSKAVQDSDDASSSQERLKASYVRRTKYNRCCKSGQVKIPLPREPPEIIKELFKDRKFMENIRAYNLMFVMTSFKANVDESVNDGSGPYVFKVEGQISHWMGSMCPPPDQNPRFLQMYIYDTNNEVCNRLRHFNGGESEDLKYEIVQTLIDFFDEYNDLVRLFRTTRDMCAAEEPPEFKIRLYNSGNKMCYNAPASGTLGAIVYDSRPRSKNDFDIIIHMKDKMPHRISKLHPSYMALQFPLLFLFGEHGWSPELKLVNRKSRGARQMTMNMFYSFQLHDRFNRFALLPRGGRLFQQYLVNAYISIEHNRLDYIESMQDVLRSEYLQDVHDALLKGDSDGHDVGKRTILPLSFTGSPRYMYKHYQDALAICRVHENPQYFITFTCNVRWSEIHRYLQNHPEMKSANRPDIIARVFEMKVRDFISYLKNEKPFGQVAVDLYTIEFQKRGLPHCHTLLWVTPPHKVNTPEQVDQFIPTEIHDGQVFPELYKIVTELMIHGSCGLANKKAPCMVGDTCSKRFLKQYEDITRFDKDGHVHYMRRNDGRFVIKNKVKLDNSYVIPYNKHLLLVFRAHICDIP